jgi:hypothetical protein
MAEERKTFAVPCYDDIINVTMYSAAIEPFASKSNSPVFRYPLADSIIVEFTTPFYALSASLIAGSRGDRINCLGERFHSVNYFTG